MFKDTGKFGDLVFERSSIRGLASIVGLSNPTVTKRVESNEWLQDEICEFCKAIGVELVSIIGNEVNIRFDGTEVTCGIDKWNDPETSRSIYRRNRRQHAKPESDHAPLNLPFDNTKAIQAAGSLQGLVPVRIKVDELREHISRSDAEYITLMIGVTVNEANVLLLAGEKGSVYLTVLLPLAKAELLVKRIQEDGALQELGVVYAEIAESPSIEPARSVVQGQETAKSPEEMVGPAETWRTSPQDTALTGEFSFDHRKEEVNKASSTLEEERQFTGDDYCVTILKSQMTRLAEQYALILALAGQQFGTHKLTPELHQAFFASLNVNLLRADADEMMNRFVQTWRTVEKS